MQSYEEAGGYGLPAYYDMSLAAAGAYPASSLMAAYGIPGAMAATYGLAGLGGIPRRGMGVAGLAAARGGRGAMLGLGGLAAMRGRGAALAALGRGGAVGAAGAAGGVPRGAGRGAGGKMMRGRGGQRFNPLAAAKPSNPSENELGHIVFAYNIGETTTEEDVKALFSLYGTVAKVDVIWDYNKNITKGYAFVTMPNYEEAEYAISQLNGYNYAGKPLQVSFKTDKKDNKKKNN